MINTNFQSIKFKKEYYGWYLLAILLVIWIIGFFWNIIFNHNQGSFLDLMLIIIDSILSLVGQVVNPILAFFNIPKTNWIIPVFGSSGRNYVIMKSLADASVITLQLSILAMVFGFGIALILATIMSLPKNFLQRFVQIYIDYHRSTPLLVQLLIIYLAIPPFVQSLGPWVIQNNLPIFGDIFLFIANPLPSFTFTEFTAGLLGLTLNTGAYQAEIIRGGIGAIPTGQTEAARGLGMTTAQTMRYVILPQAIRLIIPPLTNEGINVILNSSLVSVVSVFELTLRARTLASYYFNTLDIYLQAAAFYFVIAFSLAKLAKRAEKKLRIPGLGMHHEQDNH